MRVILHGIKSLLRRPAKTVMLFLILFVVFNLIFTGFIIENSIMQSKEFIRMQIGSAVEYRINNDSLMSYVGSGIQGDRNRTMSLPSLSLQVAEKISMHSFVNNYYVSESADANSSNMSPAQTQQTSGGFRMSFSDFTLIGTNNPEPLDFALGNVSLSNGSLLSAENISRADKVIMI